MGEKDLDGVYRVITNSQPARSTTGSPEAGTAKGGEAGAESFLKRKL